MGQAVAMTAAFFCRLWRGVTKEDRRLLFGLAAAGVLAVWHLI